MCKSSSDSGIILTEEKHFTSKMKRTDIPKKIHFIWFGSMLPETKDRPYRRNVALAKLHNPNYEVTLYTDSSTMSKRDFESLEDWCIACQIELTNLDSYSESSFTNLSHIKFELNYANWARASDIARMTILRNDGGFYFDTDLIPKKKLGIMHAPLGMLQYIVDSDPLQRCNIYFMAAIPKHPLFIGCVDYLNKIYKKIETFNFNSWIKTTDANLCKYVTGNTTGGAFESIFKLVINQKEQEKIKFNIAEYVKIVCDQSWLCKDTGIDIEARLEFIKYAEWHEKYLERDFKSFANKIKIEHDLFIKTLQFERVSKIKDKIFLGFFSSRDLLTLKLVNKKIDQDILSATIVRTIL